MTKDPRYLKIKETRNNTLKRPKNYRSNSNLEKYKGYEQKLKNMLAHASDRYSPAESWTQLANFEVQDKSVIKNSNFVRKSIQPSSVLSKEFESSLLIKGSSSLANLNDE